MPKVDFFIVNENCIVEFDESQHFTQSRKITLENYPEDLQIGFNKNRWLSLCEKYNSNDNSPIYRDEQRAWYDTLRDFAPGVLGLNPTIRIHASDEKWCELDPQNEDDIEKFKNYFGVSAKKLTKEIKVKVFESKAPKIGRIILAFDWTSKLEKAKMILHTICDHWPRDITVDFLMTPGAFLGFKIPHELLRDLDNKEPLISVQGRLFKIAENVCRDLLDENLINKLSKLTRYISLGVDSFKTKVSLSYVNIRNPHAELVALYDLLEGEFFWTGKSFPTVGQEDGLIRVTDLDSHFIQTAFGKAMVLGCHDLSVYSNRGMSTTKNKWRKKIRDEFRGTAKKQKPKIVLHHPHNTDSSRTWTPSWNELQIELPMVKVYAGAGKYYRQEGNQRSNLENVLKKTN